MILQTDLGYPRLAILVWVDDGSCRQIVLTGTQRQAIIDTVSRMHDFKMKISNVQLPIKWPDPKPVDKGEAVDTLEHGKSV